MAKNNSNNSTETKPTPMTESEIRKGLLESGLENIDIPFLYELMAVPSYSCYEFRMATFIMLWAKRNNVDFKMDTKGNLYLTKGTLEEGEFYPCVTSHMDTVQDKAKPFILAGADLPLKTRIKTNTKTKVETHEVYVENQGIGADDKTGVFICLSIMSKVDKLKAAFFVEEEVGMKGSELLDKSFFDDVAYVIGWDSPDLNRAAWRCNGVILFTRDFYENGIKPVVERWGMSDKSFNSEPFTDVVEIRSQTDVVCCNFGNGGYYAHTTSEYIVVEHVDHAVGMGVDLVKSLGNKKKYKIERSTQSYKANLNEDEKYITKLFGGWYYDYSSSNVNKSNNLNVNNQTKNTTNNVPSSELDDKVFKYVIDTYDAYINNVKEKISNKCDVITDLIKDKFREVGIDFESFDVDIKKEILKSFDKEITF
jgi:hypothetical protein